eukprot:m.160339 g.160339  ORF g.160339 m.160339 type:complete len:236 (-) comp18021_c0_seq3:681-1388(-)
MSATQKLFAQIAVLAAGQVLMYWTVKWLIKQMDPNRDKKDAAKQLSSKVLRRLKQGKIQLSEHEDMVAADVIDPSDIETTWEDIGGMENTIAQLTESVVLPLTRPELFPKGSKLLRAPRGVLLYGPPGCGKTMIAKALAKEANCCFIALQPSTYMDKWYGESQKLVDAVFSLAEKLQPSIIFLDEIDAFLRVKLLCTFSVPVSYLCVQQRLGWSSCLSTTIISSYIALQQISSHL